MLGAYACEIGKAKTFQRSRLYPLPGRARQLGHGEARVSVHGSGKMTRRSRPVATYERTRPRRR
jgi:hypothetical protein